ncbi:holo-ACP synthase [Mycoplasma sp. 480]|uniref:holo-ACP synthase n=1 Tax=Mycoplasma sp. 480 TaxID=3440155 RepID=UPI003F515BEA
MIGVDIISISRFKGKKENFIKRILSENEWNSFIKTENKEKFLATRWAIKEAIFKADNKYFNFKQIDIYKENKKYKFQNFEISTSNDEDTVIAVAIKKE